MVGILRFSLLILLFGSACTVQRGLYSSLSAPEGFRIEKIESDSLFDSRQSITLVIIPEEAYQEQSWGLAYSSDTLRKTSDFAMRNNAAVAINAGFFDMKKGGSVTFLEAHGAVVTSTYNENGALKKTNPVLNGALVITSNNQIVIEFDRGEDEYAQSDKERAVIVTGPVLVHKGNSVVLKETKFVTNRHPRSCVCTTNNHDILLIAVDGRRPRASGMNLMELQEFLLEKGCIDAINLDGGGSTTLWMKGRGVLNSPSDLFGERAVANIIYLRDK